MLRQLGIAFRSLRRQPTFFAMAVAALALGIAAPTALFAVVRAALLKPLPYARSAELYTVRTTMTDGRFTIGLVASEEINEMRRATDMVTASALVWRWEATLLPTGGFDARQLRSVQVSEEFFDVFGVPMAQGRAFTPEDFGAATVPAAIVSDHAWRAYFGADPSLVGRRVALAAGPVLVVGIAPPAFDVPHDNELWVATHFPETVGHGFDAFVRLRPGATPAAVSKALEPMWRGLAQKYPDQEKNRVFVMRPLLESIVGDLGPIALIAFGATALLLALAVANVANLLLARGAARARELAVRLSLGARTRHLIAQLLAESMLIAAVSAAIGLPLAYGAIRTIAALGGRALPRADGLTFDPVVAAFAVAVMVGAGIVVGLLPALSAGSVKLASAMNEGGRAGMQSGRTRRMLAALVVGEIAMAVALVAGAGRLALSVKNLLAVDPGFSSAGRLAVDVVLPPTVTSPQVWLDDARGRLIAAGAGTVELASSLPLRPELDSTTFTDIIGRPVAPQYRPNARLRFVTPGLFDSLGMRIVAGRGLTIDDRNDTAPVAVVNQAWADKFLPGLDPMRERIAGLFVRRGADGRFVSLPAAIVGVAGDVRYARLDRSAEPTVYLSLAQRPTWRFSLVVTSPNGHPESLAPGFRAALRALDPAASVDLVSLDNLVGASMIWSRLGVMLLGTFGVVSLVLAGAGVFGVLAFVGAQRHGEMAVRLSLGATRGSVFGLLFAQGARFALAGLVVGTLLAWWMGALMSAYVYQVSAASVSVLAGSAGIVALVALAATVAPARRAALVHPSRVLRP